MRKKSFRKILIANRGEIALRVMRTCREMGIATVAVYSEADADAPHTCDADEAVFIGPAPSRDSYLSIETIIDAARRTGADAIHPGYGFLSERAEFAESCAAAGVVFIGPSAQVIRRMGLKSLGRRLMTEAGVPVVPGFDGERQDRESLRAEMIKIGLPVLIKASAGGGGKGMRVVRSEAEIEGAIDAARREAERAFGDGALLLEKYVERARHVEVQILGDHHGNLVHLFERDCSLQRRHQKIVEESPSPALNEELRRSICEAAIKAGRAMGYTNAGTVEFILSDQFYFIEVNTRLQVEHPVTEMITGLDLVKAQIEIAEGRPLPFTQSEVRRSGHAVEARLYAEDRDLLPSTGKIVDWCVPEASRGLRIDSGVATGIEVGIHYDPLLAKVIAHADDRPAALRKLRQALSAIAAQGIRTNRELLIRLLETEDFERGEVHTGYLEEHLNELITPDDSQSAAASLIAVALYRQRQWRNANGLPPGYRNNPFRAPSIKLRLEDRETEVSWRRLAGERYEVEVFGSSVEVQVISCEPDAIRLSLDGIQRSFRIVSADDRFYVHSTLGPQVIKCIPRHPIRQSAPEAGAASSPMPGQVLRILVETGQRVAAGEPLIILAAMKMEHTMRAAVDGVVEKILVEQGEVVGPGQTLVQIAPVDQPGTPRSGFQQDAD
ncbi:MAG TPA: acetyl-CoA carboxylase biotin carboxylase subunit [Blastocatellia bacterium]|nr:acetyl-CoA carboxylase biotin carboxylase subunit [Blastocatellia bacterium]